MASHMSEHSSLRAAPSVCQSRDVDEVSIASDFSIINESLVDRVEAEDVRLAAAAAAAAATGGSSVGGRGGEGSSSAPAEGGGREEAEELVEEPFHYSTSSFLQSSDLHISSAAMKTHGKVKFHNLQPNYYMDTDIPVTYTLSENIQPVSSDRVGLYKVGFATILDYVDYLWAPVPSQGRQRAQQGQGQCSLPVTVVFKASSFQKEQNAGEFFQFCYVTHSGEIVGVSSPFQLLRVGAAGGEVCGVEEEEVEGGGAGGDDAMVVVRSKESVLQESLLKVREERDALMVRVEEAEGRKEELERKVEEQTQQLSLCQHHLQALEVKLKRETSEKCELMGRVGQVVEERGHLEERVRQLERSLEVEKQSSTHLHTLLAKGEEKVRTMKEAALVHRKAQEDATIKMKSLNDDLSHNKHILKTTMEMLDKVRLERDKAVKELTFWTANSEVDQQEKNSLAQKYSEVTEELITKEQELQASHSAAYTMQETLNSTQECLATTTAKLSSVSQRVEELEEERKILLERENVVKGDMANLKERLATLEEEQREAVLCREAAESIASDLSGRLQAARTEYRTLATTNHRLLKKIKRTRRIGEASFSSSGSGGLDTDAEATKKQEENKKAMMSSTASWVCATMGEEEEDDEEEEEGEGGVEEVGVSLAQSTTTTTTTHSCCSHSTQQLSQVVNQKMEDIVRELSQQILSLRHQLEEKERSGRVKEAADVEEKEARRCEGEMERESGEGEEEEGHEVSGKAPVTSAVLYGKSFLPTATTAPVFLPERSTHPSTSASTPPTHAASTHPQAHTTHTNVASSHAQTHTTSNSASAHAQTPNTHTNTASTHAQTHTTHTSGSQVQHQIKSGCVPTSSPSQTITAPHSTKADPPAAPTAAPRPQYYLPQPPSTALPPPLLPESTQTARQAAVLSQFTQLPPTSSSTANPSAPPFAPHHESDDEDYHSTDSDTPPTSPPPSATPAATRSVAVSRPQQIPRPSQQQQTQQQNRPTSPHLSPGSSPTAPPLLDCPLCSLCFPLGTLRLLEEHINSHLEHVCPVCSQAFHRNCRDKFKEHVQSHFSEEEDEEEDERAREHQQAPRDNSGPWGDLRGSHLLEID